MKRLWLPVLAFGLLFSGCADTTENETLPVALTSPGQGVFLNQCAVCHRGTGNPPGPNSVILGSARLTDEKTFEQFLRNPQNAGMPSFPESSLGEADVHELFVYIKTLQTPQPN